MRMSRTVHSKELRMRRLLLILTLVLALVVAVRADDPTSKYVSLAPIATTLPPSSIGVSVQFEIERRIFWRERASRDQLGSPQLGVFRLGLLEDRDIRVGSRPSPWSCRRITLTLCRAASAPVRRWDR